MVRSICARVVTHSLPIGTINNTTTESKGMVQITIQSIHDEFRKNLTCLIVPAIADLIPSEIFPRESLRIPPNIKLADPNFHLPRPVDLLIGSGATISLFSIGQINLSHKGQDLYLQKTRLGWVVAGGTSSQLPVKNATCHLTNLENQLLKFWIIEEVGTDRSWSAEEMQCEAHFKKTVRRDGKGRYIVRLPFRKVNIRLGKSRTSALRRLTSLERKLDANTTLKKEYTRVIEEYIELGHMSLVEDPSDDGFYMPHHAVIKDSSNTTKVRVVFDASAKSNNGVSLNDMLMVGPTIQDKLPLHLIRFRTYRYVITADIVKMYRQVLLHKDDRRYHRILWRRNDRVEAFQINVITFGSSASPFLAIRSVHQLAEDERRKYPRAAEIIENHFYVDNLLSGAKTIEDARKIRDEIIALLSLGDFLSNNGHRMLNASSMIYP
ncbi:uncharacterized protein LOC143893560 [Temnothorax americanus]|uniref:uncharacterized protein LOC143893560 n=1 Tax=Temnothorax americanus TaxID=1964332 RepID=UPI0040687C21